MPPSTKGTWDGNAESVDLYHKTDVYSATYLQILSGPSIQGDFSSDSAIILDAKGEFFPFEREQYVLVDEQNRILDLSMLRPDQLICVSGRIGPFAGALNNESEILTSLPQFSPTDRVPRVAATIQVSRIRDAAGNKIPLRPVIAPDRLKTQQVMASTTRPVYDPLWRASHFVGVIRRDQTSIWWLSTRTVEMRAEPEPSGKFVFQYRYRDEAEPSDGRDAEVCSDLKHIVDMARIAKPPRMPLNLTPDQIARLDTVFWSDPPPTEGMQQKVEDQFGAFSVAAANRCVSDPRLFAQEQNLLLSLRAVGETALNPASGREFPPGKIWAIRAVLTPDQWSRMAKEIQWKHDHWKPLHSPATMPTSVSQPSGPMP
jgi:hypothetical protein